MNKEEAIWYFIIQKDGDRIFVWFSFLNFFYMLGIFLQFICFGLSFYLFLRIFLLYTPVFLPELGGSAAGGCAAGSRGGGDQRGGGQEAQDGEARERGQRGGEH